MVLQCNCVQTFQAANGEDDIVGFSQGIKIADVQNFAHDKARPGIDSFSDAVFSSGRDHLWNQIDSIKTHRRVGQLNAIDAIPVTDLKYVLD